LITQAVSAIRAAKVEAKCLINGVGVVKLMGRSAGYIAAHASLASGDVDLCLVPEVEMVMDGPHSCLEHVKRCVLTNGHAVVVVAEGAGTFKSDLVLLLCHVYNRMPRLQCIATSIHP
jgi:6-phosphofructokinase 1